MIAASVREEISKYLGSEARRYVISALDGGMETGCECWDLPLLKEQDKPPHVRYQEIAARIATLAEEKPGDARIGALKKEAAALIRGVPISNKFGAAVVSVGDLLKLDKWKGIRKEWWELRARFAGQGVSIFAGYRGEPSAAPPVADMLIAMPSADPYDFLRIHETRGNNNPVDTEGIISALRKLDAEYGVGIVSAAEDSVEFVFERPVERASRARIRQRLNRLCPSAEALGEGIRLGRVTLWWD